MSQTTALLDADVTPYLDGFGPEVTHESSRPVQWLSDAAVTVVMALLAPILIIPVAFAFAVACIRMQGFDLQADAGRSAGRYRSASERVYATGTQGRFRSSGDAASALGEGSCATRAPFNSHRWN